MLESPDYFFRVREIGRLRQTRSDPGSHVGRRAIARCPCTPQEPMKVRGEKIYVSSGPSKEIAGLKKMKMMTPGSQNSRVWEFSHDALKVRRGLWAYV